MPKVKKPLTQAEEMTAKEIKKSYGGTLNLQNVMSFMGISRHTAERAERFVADMDYILVNGRKRYMATDLARKIESCRVPGGV